MGGLSAFVLALGVTGPAVAESGDEAAPTPAATTVVEPADPASTPAQEANTELPVTSVPDTAEQTEPGTATPEAESPPSGAIEAAPASLIAAAAAAEPAGRVLYTERFDTSATSPVTLNAYPSADTARYTAAPYWLNAAYCNGFVMHADMAVTKAQINSTYCGPNGGTASSAQSEDDYGAVRTKAFALGKLAGLTDEQARANGTLSTNTSGGVPSTDLASADSIQFQTTSTTAVTLPAANRRFLSLSLDSAAQCGTNADEPANAPRLSIWLLAGSQTQQLTTAPINVCDATYAHVTGWALYNTLNSQIGSLRRNDGNSYASWVYPVRVGSYFGDKTFLVGTETSFGMRIRNTAAASSTGRGAGTVTGTANGNDGAIDNVRIVDVTPWLEKSFSPARVPAGGESTLTLTIRNTAEKAEKKGWSFVDTLPAGLTVLNPSSQVATGTCMVQGGAAVSLTTNSIAVAADTGWLRAGMDQCTVVVKVTSATPGSYTNDTTSNVSERIGIDPGNAASVEFYANSLLWQKADQTTLLAGSGWTLTGPNGAAAATRAVQDCTAEPCPVSGFDTDPQPGRLRVGALPDGAYVLTETQAPPGYLLAPSPRAVTLSGGAASGTDLGPIQNSPIPDATIQVQKLVQDVSGASPQPEAGWTVGVTLTPEANPPGLTLTPQGTQTTLANGSPKDPWRVRFATTDQTATLEVFETQGNDHSFASGACTITAVGGATRTVSFGADGVATLSGSGALRPGEQAVCALTNRQLPGGVSWQKVDSADSATPLSGSQWQIVDQGPAGTTLDVIDCVAQTEADCASGPDLDPGAGKLRVAGLNWGSYELTETQAPTGFYLDPTPWAFTVAAGQRIVTLDPIVNQRRDVPVIPLTGGLGRDAFGLLGLGLLAVGIGAAATVQLRQRRRGTSARPQL